MDDKTIFRKPHNRDNPYVVITKTIFEDDSISWKAKGLMGYLLSRPDDWVVRLGDLVKRSTDGRSSVRSALKELEDHGYLIKNALRDESGRFSGTEMLVSEYPQPTACEKPHTDNPTSVFPPTENRTVLSIDSLPSTDLPNTEDTKERGATAPTPPANPADAHRERMRAKMGDNPFSVGAHCVEQQAVEGAWTVPEHNGLSPQCAVFKEATGYRPAAAVRDDIDAAIPDNEEALHNWYRVAHGWILTGYSYRNVAGMLEWYAEGRVGRDRPNGGARNGGPSTPRKEQPTEIVFAEPSWLGVET